MSRLGGIVSSISELDREKLRALTKQDTGRPVLSVYARTDPRDPANTNHMPAWEIELRNGLASIEKDLDGNGGHEDRKRFKELRSRVERELGGLRASDRGRSVAWFLSADGAESQRFALQLPVRRDRAVWSSRPYVLPLVDVVERGTATGLVTVSGDHVRLLHFEMGLVTEPEDSTYQLDLGEWRPYQAYAAPNPARGQQSVSHVEHYEARLAEQRNQFFETAAKATGKRLAELGWERVAIVAEPQLAGRFTEHLPDELARRVVATIDFNVGHEDPGQIASAVEPRLEQVWLDQAVAGVAEACERAAGGGAAAVGPQEVLGALGESRVEHLYLDPEADLGKYAAAAPPSIAGPASMLAERAVEAAIATGARVSPIPPERSSQLDEAGGMAALLRY